MRAPARKRSRSIKWQASAASRTARVRWLVTYDIADLRRLARLFKYLKKQGAPVQYSVFLVEASAMKMSNLIVQMAKLVDANADDVRAYHLPATEPT